MVAELRSAADGWEIAVADEERLYGVGTEDAIGMQERADMYRRAAALIEQQAAELAETLHRANRAEASRLHHKEKRLAAEARVTALEAEKAGLVADKERLDFLDRCNAALNGRYGTSYGWSLVLTHNVTRLMLGRSMEVDLHDSEGGNTKLPSCRGAIDREMTRIDVARRAQALSRSSTEVKNDAGT